MPVLIDEIIVEIQDGVTEASEVARADQQAPLTEAEAELIQTLARIQQRQDRLKID